MRSITFQNVTIETLTLDNNNDISIISPPGAINDITTIIASLQSDETLAIRTLALQGNFGDSAIYVTNNCILLSDSTFSCNNPIIISNEDNPNNEASVFLSGDFSGCSEGFVISGNVKLSTYNDKPISAEQLNITAKENSQLTLTGDFSNTPLIIEDNTSLIVNGSISSLTATNSTNTLNLVLNEGASISTIENISNVTLSGDATAIKEFTDSNPNINFTILSTSYITAFNNGIGNLKLSPLLSKGSYKITVSVLSENEEYILPTQVTIAIA